VDPLVGKTLSHYRVVERIGAGGMGEVYRARDEHLERDVALKVLPSGALANDAVRRQFRKEALALSKLNHPNIATVFDFDTQEGVDFLVMEYVAGEMLSERLRSGPLPEKEIARLGVELADGLMAAHGQGVIHRDLKPGNVRLTPDGRLKILDFGLAKMMPHAGGVVPAGETFTASMTEVHALAGTLPYMAPEQLRGGPVDARSDLWAAGLILYELAAGRRAFSEPDSAGLIAAILHETPALPSAANRRVSVGLESIIAKCLEKEPESRYQSAKELAVDLRRLGAPSLGRGPSQIRGRRRPLRVAAAAAVAVAVLAVLFLAWNQLSRPRSPHASPPGKKDWILVAEFEGPPGDSSLAVTTRDLVSAALDQSEIVATVPREQIKVALQSAGKPENSRVDAELAKELAYRSAVRAVLEGKIGQLGRGYSVVLRVVDAESLNVIVAESAVAKNQDDLIPTLGRLAEKLRAGLGERRNAIRATRPMFEVATPSFEAYRLFVHAWDLNDNSAPREAILVSREAIALDPDFALAWVGVGTGFWNSNQPDSALAAFDEALSRPQRLTMVQRRFVEAMRANTEGDLKGALTAYDGLLRHNPTGPAALMNRGVVLNGLGRLEEALESTRMAGRASPFGATQGMRNNEVVDLCDLGRLDEARAVTPYLRGSLNGSVRLLIEFRAKNWAAVERLSDSLLADPGLREDLRADVLLTLGSAQAARGAFKTAAATFERTEETARAGALPMHLHAAYRGRLMLAAASRGGVAVPVDSWAGDSSAAACITRGLRATMGGDRSGAERYLNLARTRSRRELAWQGAAPALLEARIQALAGRWGEVARILRPVASRRVEIGELNYPAGMPAIQWLLADAFEQLGQADSAAVTLETVTSDPVCRHWTEYARGTLIPLAHRRLVLLYAGMGRIQDAQRHWRIFTEMFRTPDPEIRPLIEEARAALRRAEEAAAKGGSRA
jgi:tetratricopeptide (TPR) repeat protein/predicted Ser/Thr protein kinase